MNEAYFLTMAIYFHTIFEGIAIGVQDTITGFLSTAIAIAFHKWADALSMGIHYRNRNISNKIGYRLIILQAILNVAAIAGGILIA
jgi:zinc transporter 1/2/3